METPDLQKILEEETSDKTDLAEALDDFERNIWPVYEARGYSKSVALLSYSMGIITDTATILAAEIQDEDES